jgi:hypothetical protein
MAIVDLTEPTRNFIEMEIENYFYKEIVNNKEIYVGYISFYDEKRKYQTIKIKINKVIKMITNEEVYFYIDYSLIIKNSFGIETIKTVDSYFYTPDIYSVFWPKNKLNFKIVGRTPQISLRLLIENNHKLKIENFT